MKDRRKYVRLGDAWRCSAKRRGGIVIGHGPTRQAAAEDFDRQAKERSGMSRISTGLLSSLGRGFGPMGGMIP